MRIMELRAMRELLDGRLQAARAAGDDALTKTLSAEQERWLSLVRGSMLPAFLRVTPAVFSLKPAGQPIRVVAFGDFGRGRLEQKQVADAILAEHRLQPFDFGLTTGDNFYPRGMDSPSDPRWKTYWEDLYTRTGIKFYASMGNHDWYGLDSPAAEILYSEKSQSWRLPAPYYTYTAGSAQFFAVDTDEMGDQQLRWLKEELESSAAAWKVVYGHHPVYAASTFGKEYTEEMRKRLLPVIRGRADVYLCGHHHSLQHLQPDGGTHFFISGAGGASTYPVGERDEERGEPALYARSEFGFSIIEANERELSVRHMGRDGQKLYSHTLRK
jgi:hypothetical protein